MWFVSPMKVTKIDANNFDVQGVSDTYYVHFGVKGPSCTCMSWVIHGSEKNFKCKHALRVLEFIQNA